ncbi:hypothetical protein HAX54_001634 [Datura stramonium]|uniref:Uncharacterized protein n=1 Tax=Datura stramonium TaxID=4076 RepID=A0ABS8T3Q6_DATST|nr:hypothetical protein [Datura stramonium]
MSRRFTLDKGVTWPDTGDPITQIHTAVAQSGSHTFDSPGQRAVRETLRDRRRRATSPSQFGPQNQRRTRPEPIYYCGPPRSAQRIPIQPSSATAWTVPEMGGLGTPLLHHQLLSPSSFLGVGLNAKPDLTLETWAALKRLRT